MISISMLNELNTKIKIIHKFNTNSYKKSLPDPIAAVRSS
jgi:hypothetical protein